jgi:hypothetical protein
MKKTTLFLCVWFILLGVVGTAKAILYTIDDDGNYIFAPEFNGDQFWRSMELDDLDHSSLKRYGTALWDEERRHPPYTISNNYDFVRGLPDWDKFRSQLNRRFKPRFVRLPPTPVAESPAPVPEPATLMLVGAGLIGIAALKRKKFSKGK